MTQGIADAVRIKLGTDGRRWITWSGGESDEYSCPGTILP